MLKDLVKRRAYHNKWYAKNKKRILVERKEERRVKSEQFRAYHREWSSRNKQKIHAYYENGKTKPHIVRHRKESSQQYYIKNKEHILGITSKYVSEHLDEVTASRKRWESKFADKIRKRKAEYRIANLKRIKEGQAEWRRNNPDKQRAGKARRRSKELEVEGSFTAKEWIDLCNKYGDRCLACGKQNKLTADHVIPLSVKGSTNYISNIQSLCGSCNSSKGTKTIDYRPLWGNKIMWCNHAED